MRDVAMWHLDRPGGGRAENGPQAGLGLLLAPAPAPWLWRDAPDPASPGMREGTQLPGHRLGRQDTGSGSAVCLLNYCWTSLVRIPPHPYAHTNTHTHTLSFLREKPQAGPPGDQELALLSVSPLQAV